MKTNGFTLVEILVTTAILTLVFLGVFSVLNVADMSWNTDMGILDLQQAARQSMDGLTREIRQSDPDRNVTIGNAGLTLQLYVPNVSDAINYSLSNGQIIREHPNGVNRVLANDISFLSFCWGHSNGSCTTSRDCGGVCSKSYSLEVQLRATKTVKQRVVTFPSAGPLVEEVKLRNE